jgi:thiamine biosynthesis lipoprotein
MFPFTSLANKNIYNYHWKGSALGNPVEMKIYTKHKNHLDKLLVMTNTEIDRLDKIFYLQNAFSKINLLNKNKILINPDIELINAIYLSEKFFKLRKGSFDITIQPLWNAYSSGKKVVLNSIGFNNIEISKNKITLLNKDTELTLNALAQGILTDRILEILLNSGMKNHLINFGEGKSSGLGPHEKKWTLYVDNKYIDITNKGFSVSEANSTILPDGKSHLFNAKIYNSALNIPSKTTVIAKSATLADGLSTTYAVSNKIVRNNLIKHFSDAQFIINT